MTLFKTVALSAATLAVLALPSLADDWHHGGRGDWHGGRGGWHGGSGWRGGSGVSIGIGVPLYSPYYYGPGYYGPGYYGRTYYDTAPVVVGREVGGGDVVADVQSALARKGYYTGEVDGAMGPRSRAAIRAWQADVGLRVTGTLNTATLRSLGLL
jgi:hypothetical protein